VHADLARDVALIVEPTPGTRMSSPPPGSPKGVVDSWHDLLKRIDDQVAALPA
jgi:hypothetical protein